MKLTLVTTNKGKLNEFKEILGENFEIEHIILEYPELRSDDPLEIAKDAAKRLSRQLKKPIVVEDSGLFIKALKDFPGTCSSYIHKRIGLKGILLVMQGIENREAEYKSAVAYCEPRKKPVAFLGKESGTIAKSIRGNNGFGHDPIFIPKGSDKTYGEIENCEKIKKFRRMAIEQLVEYLKKKKY